MERDPVPGPEGNQPDTGEGQPVEPDQTEPTGQESDTGYPRVTEEDLRQDREATKDRVPLREMEIVRIQGYTDDNEPPYVTGKPKSKED
jgi:hypothetical protein